MTFQKTPETPYPAEDQAKKALVALFSVPAQTLEKGQPVKDETFYKTHEVKAYSITPKGIVHFVSLKSEFSLPYQGRLVELDADNEARVALSSVMKNGLITNDVFKPYKLQEHTPNRTGDYTAITAIKKTEPNKLAAIDKVLFAISEEAYHQLAVITMGLLSDGKQGAAMCGEPGARSYKKQLEVQASLPSTVIKNIVQSGVLTDKDYREIEAYALNTENYEFLSRIKQVREDMARGAAVDEEPAAGHAAAVMARSHHPTHGGRPGM